LQDTPLDPQWPQDRLHFDGDFGYHFWSGAAGRTRPGRAGTAAPPAGQRSARRHPHRAVGARDAAAVDTGACRGPWCLPSPSGGRIQPVGAEGFLLSRHGSGTRVATVDAAGLSRATPAILRSSSTSTSRPAHRISVAFRGMPGYGRCGKASPRSSRTHSAMSHRRVCPLHASQWRTICGALAACSPTRGTSCCAPGQHRPSPCWPQCYPIRRWRWRIQGSGCIGWCCDTTVSSPYQFRSMRTGWTSRASRTAMRRWCWPPRPIKHRPVWCSPQLA
jgi:hypothetical protein